ncbi:ABC transporter substrate-binding protein [Desulfonema ishimotonii]|uniref:ABC transporter substrate-binding protein n=1 Tax=Desulfonema ishimotonii TaxID=45657 RepID=A0A401FXA7_9BACT|nr:ABC transporter substrate-binding protein [Desulfonema ishimotonii]GBC61563.1 ABC transporter substrate-binding protein [Desulfonema ishimotonii]
MINRYAGAVSLAASVFLITCFALSCGNPALAHDRPESPVLTIGVGRDFYDGPDSRAFLHGSTGTWEGLTYFDKEMRAAPWLAESWEHADDGKTWIFRLRKGVRFHDGTPMTSREVTASLRRISSHSKYDPAANYRHVVSITARGPGTIVFRLDRPVPYFPKLLAYYSSPVIHPSCFDEAGRLTKLIATGPYRIEKVRPGEAIRLSAFDGYWGKKPTYRQVVFKTIPDAQTRLMALMAGEIDVVADVGGILPEQAEELRAYPGIVLKQQEVATTHVMVFNCGKPPFRDRDFRLWFCGMLERGQLVDAFAGGAGVVARDPYTGLARDVAFGMIRPSAHPRPGRVPEGELVITLHGGVIQRWPYMEMAQIVQEKLREQGIAARIEIREAGAYHEGVKKGNFSLAIQPYTLMTGDPDFFYTYWIASDAPRNTGWHDAEADRLIRTARHEMVPDRRRDLYRRLEEIFSRNLPLLPLYHDVSLYAHRKTVGQFEMDHLFRPLLTEARPAGELP